MTVFAAWPLRRQTRQRGHSYAMMWKSNHFTTHQRGKLWACRKVTVRWLHALGGILARSAFRDLIWGSFSHTGKRHRPSSIIKCAFAPPTCPLARSPVAYPLYLYLPSKLSPLPLSFYRVNIIVARFSFFTDSYNLFATNIFLLSPLYSLHLPSLI